MRGNDGFDIRGFFKNEIGVQSEEILDIFERSARIVTYRKGEVICRPGNDSKVRRFLLNGISRGYVLGENGQDTVICFNYRFADPLLGASTLGGKSHLFLEAITDLETLEIPLQIAQQGIERDHRLLQVYEDLVSRDYVKQLKIHVALSNLTGMERYQWFCKEYKDITNEVPQNYIASFLGIQPQSLSRIKRQMKEKK